MERYKHVIFPVNVEGIFDDPRIDFAAGMSRHWPDLQSAIPRKLGGTTSYTNPDGITFHAITFYSLNQRDWIEATEGIADMLEQCLKKLAIPNGEATAIVFDKLPVVIRPVDLFYVLNRVALFDKPMVVYIWHI